MTPETIILPSPPRRVMPAGQGAMMLELEDEVVVVRKSYTILKRVCMPEEPGERLLWPLGENRCVMLGHAGVVKVYEDDKVVDRRPGIFNEQDELVYTVSAGNDRTVVLIGRMTGDPLILPVPEYRFVVLKNTVQLVSNPKMVMKRKPVGWGVHEAGSMILVVVSETSVEKLSAAPLEQGEAQELTWPTELAGQRITQMSVETARGDLAIAVRGRQGCELGLVENPCGKAAKYFSVAAGGTEIDQPAWSPDGRSLSYRLETKNGKSLMVVTLLGKLTRTLSSLQEGDDTLWLDADTLALVRWDKIERLSLLN